MTKDLVTTSKQLTALYQESTDMGLEDAGEQQSYPVLKLTTSMSKENILANGKHSELGALYHTELKRDFATVTASVCYVGKYLMPDYTTKEPKQTYIVGAVMPDNSPFVMFVKGYSLQNMWAFIAEVANIKNRYQLPMFALQVEIGVTQRPHEKFKQVDVYKFTVLRDEDETPFVEQDFERASNLRALTSKFKEVAQQMAKSEEEIDEYTDQSNQNDEDYEEIPPVTDEDR